MVRHLDSFVSKDVQDRIDRGQFKVSSIYGKGTTWRQTSEVDSFYTGLKSSLRESMDGHLKGQVERFGQYLEPGGIHLPLDQARPAPS